MEQFVITFGMGVALTFGVVLLALVLKAAVASSRLPVGAKIVNPTELMQEPVSYADCDLVHAVRGYDTPELFQQDSVARRQQLSEQVLN